MIFDYFSQNESVISKMDSCTSYKNKPNTHMLYDCRDIGGFLEVTLLWIHPIHQNLCRTQWPRVGSNIDSRDYRCLRLRDPAPLKAVCHVSDWPLQSELNTTEFFVNLCICNKEGLMFLTFYGRRKSEDHQPFKFPIICIVIFTQSNA